MSVSVAGLEKVWNALDDRRFDTAERHLEPLLEKYPNELAVRLSHMLLLQGVKDNERAKELAFSIVDKDLDKVCTQQHFIQQIAHVLQVYGELDTLAKVYKKAVAVYPKEENLLENTVVCLACIEDFKEAQKIAMQLFRLSQKPAHQTWAIMCNLFAVPADAAPNNLLLQIATKMLEQQLGAKTSSYQGAGMYVDAVKRQQQYTKALDFVTSEEGVLLGMESTRLEQCYDLFVKQGEFGKAAACSLFLWKNLEPDNWSYFEKLLFCLETGYGTGETKLSLNLGLKDGAKFKVEVEAPKSLDDVAGIVEKLVDAEKPKAKKLRGPFLASLEVAHKKQDASLLAKNLVRFLEFFSTKAVCFWDVSKYAGSLRTMTGTSAQPQQVWWDDALPKESEVSDSSDLKDHLKLILRFQLEILHLGDTPKTEELQALVKKCLVGLAQSAQLSKDLKWSEEGLTDGYAVVALNAALKGYMLKEDLHWIWIGLHVLTQTPRKKNNPNLLIFSSLFHTLLGVVDVEAWQQLDIKSVQYDSMALVDLHVLLRSLQLTDKVNERLHHSDLHYSRTENELREVRGKILKHVAPTKQAEVNLFQENMRNSIARLEAHVYGILYGFSQCDTRKDLLKHLERSRKILLSIAKLQDEEIKDHNDPSIIRSVTFFEAGGDSEAAGNKAAEAMERALLPRASLEERISSVRWFQSVFMWMHDAALKTVLDDELKQKAVAAKSGGKKGKKNSSTTAGGGADAISQQIEASYKNLRLTKVGGDKDRDLEKVLTSCIPLGLNQQESKLISTTMLQIFRGMSPALDTPVGTKFTTPVKSVSCPELAEFSALCKRSANSRKLMPFIQVVLRGVSFIGEGKAKEVASFFKGFQSEQEELDGGSEKWREQFKNRDERSNWFHQSEGFESCGINADVSAQCEKEFNEKLDEAFEAAKREATAIQLEAKIIN